MHTANARGPDAAKISKRMRPGAGVRRTSMTSSTTEPARTVPIGDSPTLTPLLAMTCSPPGAPVEYVVGGQQLTGADRERAAQLLADDAMVIRCGNAPALEYWRARRDGGPPQTGTRKVAVETFASIGFGLPASPDNEDHLQGHVAELLWNRVIAERRVCLDGRRLLRAHPVKADPLEPGGDGLVIYKTTAGVLVFRLWEVKKHEPAQAGRVSGTIRRASRQLSSRGKEYLAKLVGPGTLDNDGPIGDLYANLVELWLDNSDRAGAGVSVGTSTEHAPARPTAFRSIATAFPAFNQPGQTEGIVVAVPDFSAFAARVREVVWSGL